MTTHKDLSTIFDYPVRYSLDLFCPQFSNFNLFHFVHKHVSGDAEFHGWVWTHSREEFSFYGESVVLSRRTILTNYKKEN